MELEQPTGFFLNLISNPAFFPVNHKVAQENPEWHAEADTYVSNGPFKLKEWNHDENSYLKETQNTGMQTM